jgi:hypothetical protein
VRDESARRGRSKTLDAAYVIPYEITRIEGPYLVFIPKFEIGGKELVIDKSSLRGRSRKLVLHTKVSMTL